jgi:hypothetical protein
MWHGARPGRDSTWRGRVVFVRWRLIDVNGAEFRGIETEVQHLLADNDD